MHYYKNVFLKLLQSHTYVFIKHIMFFYIKQLSAASMAIGCDNIMFYYLYIELPRLQRQFILFYTV